MTYAAAISAPPPTASDASLAISDPAVAAAEPRLAALLGSRICHDLISPVGAIGNGLELMKELGGRAAADGAELELIGRSADAASSVLQLYRLAFGAASPDERTPRAAIRRVLARWMVHQRADLDWPDDRGAEELLRPDARLLCNLVQVAAGALPRGGLVRVERADEAAALQIRAVGTGAALSPEAAAWLERGLSAKGPEPSPRARCISPSPTATPASPARGWRRA